MNENLKGQSASAVSAVFERGINEITNEENSMLQEAIKDGYVFDEEDDKNYADTMYDAFLKSMTWFVGGKGVVVTIKYTGTNVWVEKSTRKNGLSYKFVAENGGRKRSFEVDSATWSDYSLFSGDMLKTIANELYRLFNDNEKED